MFPVPDEVVNLQFDDISDRAVRVSWAPPKKANGVLIGYKLAYQMKDNSETVKEEILPPNVTSIRVENLQVVKSILVCKMKHDVHNILKYKKYTGITCKI